MNFEDFFNNAEFNFSGGRQRRFNPEQYLTDKLGKSFVDDIKRGTQLSIIWQCYNGTVPNVWLPILKDDLRADIGKEPKFYNKSFYYVQADNGGFVIYNQPANLIFYDHVNDVFLYARKDGKIVPEDKCIESEEDARKKLNDKFSVNNGKIIYIIWPDGTKAEYAGLQNIQNKIEHVEDSSVVKENEE